MSNETSEWLANNVLVGMTDKKGDAWWGRGADNNGEPNHYPGPIPVPDLHRRLFNWEAIKETLYISPGDNGELIEVPNRAAIVRNDSHDVLGIMSDSYAIHSYQEWLVKQVETILDADLVIGSAGQLRNGAQAWVQCEPIDGVNIGGDEYRSSLLAFSSLDGSTATTYKPVMTRVVCDNTLEAARREHTGEYRVRHTSHSQMRIQDARTALQIMHKHTAEFSAEMVQLMQTPVSGDGFQKFLEKFLPLDNNQKSARGVKIARARVEAQRDSLAKMYRDDPRVAPWAGTAYGVLQLVNTYRQHERPTRGNTLIVERTMLDVISGKSAEADVKALNLLARVTS